MSTEEVKEAEVKADFFVKLPSDTEAPMGDPARSLFAETRALREEIAALRTNVAQLCVAVRGLVQLQAVMDKKLDATLKGGPGVDCAVL